MEKKGITINKRKVEIAFAVISLVFAVLSIGCLFGQIVIENSSGEITPIVDLNYFVKTYPKEISILIKSDNTPSFMASCFTETLLVASFLAVLILNIVFLTLGIINFVQYLQNKKEMKNRHFLRCVFYTLVVCMVAMTYFYKKSATVATKYGCATYVSIVLCAVITVLYWLKRIVVDNEERVDLRNDLLKAGASVLLLVGGILGATRQFSQGGAQGSALELLLEAIDFAMQGEIEYPFSFTMRCLSAVMCFCSLLLTLFNFYKEIVPPKNGNKGLVRIIVTSSFTVVGVTLYLCFFPHARLGIGLMAMIITQVFALGFEIAYFALNKKPNEIENNLENK